MNKKITNSISLFPFIDRDGFRSPATFATYHLGYGIVVISILSATWTVAVSGTGAVIFGIFAWTRALSHAPAPADSTRHEYRQDGTRGNTCKHWFRVRFASGRFRLFFRYSSSAKNIIHAWVNDHHTLRTYGSESDPYEVFNSMFDEGIPPDDLDALIAGSVIIPKQ